MRKRAAVIVMLSKIELIFCNDVLPFNTAGPSVNNFTSKVLYTRELQSKESNKEIVA